MWGIVCLATLIYPFLFALAAYGLSYPLHLQHKLRFAGTVGYVALALLPCVILGDVFLTVKSGGPTRHDDPLPLPPQVQGPKDLLEIWKKCLDVQMHFNQIELQIRNYAVTLLVAVIGASAYALKEHLEARLFEHIFSMALVILPAGILGWSAFYFMDRHWYHRLLMGSVFHTIKIEKAVGPELQLGVAIGKESPIPVLGKKVHSTQKIDLFYAAGLTFLIVLTGFVLFQDAGFTPTPDSVPVSAAPLKELIAPKAQAIPQPNQTSTQPGNPDKAPGDEQRSSPKQ